MNNERQAGTNAATLMLHKFKRPASFFAMLMLAAVFWSCDMPKSKMTTINDEYENGRYKIVVIDSCEYVQTSVYAGIVVAHKGNCKFCAARHSR